MRKICLLMLFVLGFSELIAQKITQKKDVILVDGKPYIHISKENDGYKITYKIKTLDQKIIALASVVYGDDNANNNDSHYEFIFVETNEKAYLNDVEIGMSKQIAKELYSNNVIKENTINNEGKKIFLMLHGKNPKNNRDNANNGNNNNNNNNNNNSNANNLVQRDRNGLVFIFGDNIEQDSKVIGTTTNESIAIQGGTSHIYKFYLPNGTLVAEATYIGIDSSECTIITLKDNRRHRITAKRTAESPKNIVQTLIKDYYL